MKTLLVTRDDGRKFKVTVPEGSQVTFGPFSPPPRRNSSSRDFTVYSDGDKAGTLRIYGKTKQDILAVFAGVRSFRDLTVQYMEEIISEGGSTLWKSDEHGLVQETRSHRNKVWVPGESIALPPAPRKRKK